MKILTVIKRPFCPMMRFFRNPFHLSGVVFSSFLTNAVTICWATIVLSSHDTLSRSGSRYAWITAYIHENVLAAVLLTIATVQMFALWSHRKPSVLRPFGYAILSAWWTFVFFWNVVEPGPVYSTATSLSLGIAFSAFYSFLDGHLDDEGSDAAS